MKKLLALVMALCLVLGCASALAEDATYKIGIVQLVQHPALNKATEGFQDALTEKLGDKVTFNYQNASGEANNCATIVTGFVNDNVDLIMANATQALISSMEATSEIPILGTSITDYASTLGIPEEDWTGATGLNVSGTSDLAKLDEQAKIITDMFPEAKKVALLYCSAESNSEYQIKTITPYLTEMELEVREFPYADSNDLPSIVQAACDYADVLYIPTDNTAASSTEIIHNIVVPAGKPVVAGEEGICKGCGVATLSISYYDLGRITGEMAYEVLVNGADISTMEIQYAPQVKKYNPMIVEELGISVPEGYEAIELEDSEDQE